MMKSLIIGYGVTGKSFEKFLTANSIAFDIFDEDITKLEKKESLKWLLFIIILNY